MPAFEIKNRVPADVWNGYFKFCVERNPWDKVLSHYHMHAAREGGSLSLDEYLARGRFPINYFRYTDRSGRKIIVDRILRYENLTAELSEVFAQLNIPFDGTLGVAAKSEYRTDRQTISGSIQREATANRRKSIRQRNRTARLSF